MKNLLIFLTISVSFFIIVVHGFIPDKSVSAEEKFIWAVSKTSLKNASEPAKHNIKLAAQKFDGLVIKPHETFSLSEAIGEISIKKGYKNEIMFVDGYPVKKPGGGICQMASTFYNAALLSGMTIIERHPHIKTVGHIKEGFDATISQGKKDLKVKNPYPFPLTIEQIVTNENVIIKITAPEPNKRKIRLSIEGTPVDPPTVLIKDKKTSGKRGEKGKLTIVKRIIEEENGNKKEEIISRDYYYPFADELHVE